MKKIMAAAAIVLVMSLTLTLQAMACEVGLEGSSYYEEETGMEGYFTYDEAEEIGPYYEPDLCEVYIGNPDVAIMANEYGEEEACYTSGAYTESGEIDDFVGEDEITEVCESLGIVPEWEIEDDTMWCQPVDVIEVYDTPYGGDPRRRREYENYKVWLEQQAIWEEGE